MIPRLLIRADASSDMGVGHVMRCLALAQAWQRAGGQVVFACAKLPEPLFQRLVDEGCEVFLIDGARDDCGATLECYRRIGARCLILDGYQFDGNYHSRAVGAGASVLMVDDFGNGEDYAAHWILNQNLDANPSLYERRRRGTQLLLGSRYAMLRKEYVQLAGIRRTKPDGPVRVLLTMGGSDPDNLTGRLLSILNALQATINWKIRAVLGPANPHAGFLVARWRDISPRVEIVQNPPSMPALLQWPDFVITAGGGTIWEVLFMGLPAVVVSIAENQDQILKVLQKRNLAVTVGVVPDFSNLERVAEAAVRLAEMPAERRRLAESGSELIDGFGADRVVAVILGEAEPASY